MPCNPLGKRIATTEGTENTEAACAASVNNNPPCALCVLCGGNSSKNFVLYKALHPASLNLHQQALTITDKVIVTYICLVRHNDNCHFCERNFWVIFVRRNDNYHYGEQNFVAFFVRRNDNCRYGER